MLALMLAGCASSERISEAPVPEPQQETPSREPIVLICQIDTLSPDKGMLLLGHALAPLIRRDLFCVQKISVIPTQDTNTPPKLFFSTEKGLRQFAMAYGADIIMVGLLRGDAESISLNCKAYDVKNNRFFFKRKIEKKPSEIYKMQRTVVYEFIDAIGIKPSKEEYNRIKSCSPKKLKAAICFGDGLMCEAKERNNDSLMAYQDALYEDKSLALPHAGEARVYRKLGAPLKSMQSLEDAIGRDIYYAEAWYELSVYAAEDKQRNDLAMEYCKKALEIAPRFGKARLGLGTYLYALGDTQAAIEETKLATKLLKTDPLPRYNLGVYYRNMERSEDARFWFEQALKIRPGFKRAQAELQKLEYN